MEVLIKKSELNIAATVDRDIDSLTQIHQQMRWMELNHSLNPNDRDRRDYEMLVKDMAATLEKLIRDLTGIDLVTVNPALLAASDFPLSASEILTTPAPLPPPDARRTNRPVPPTTRSP